MVRKNYGQTPAYNVITLPALQDVIRINGNLPTTFNIEQPSGIQGGLTMFPSMEMPFYSVKTQLTNQQVQLAKDGTEYEVVFMGILFYTDAFQVKHYTRYCWLYKGSSMTAKDAQGCWAHNDSN